MCESITGEYRLPPDPGGPPPGNSNSEEGLVRQLADPDLKTRSDAAMKILRHSERRAPAVLEMAIHRSGTLGDFRVLNNLERIATEHVVSEDQSDGGLIAYPTSARVSSVAAIGRILEKDRSAPPGRPSDETGDGISEDATDLALEALMVSACVGQPTELRAAAIEALGAARNQKAVDFLELLFAHPGESDDQGDPRNLFLRVVSGRSLTTITHNNHLIDSDVDERFRALIRAYSPAEDDQEAP